MKTVFDTSTREELIGRISSLTGTSQARWGRMNAYQMVKHCTLWEEMMQGKQQYKRAFMGRIFGRMALKGVLKDDTPLGRNTPTIPELKIAGTGDVLAEKVKWISRLQDYASFSDTGFVHPFFGGMTRDQIGAIAYKHSDHHLRQFGA